VADIPSVASILARMTRDDWRLETTFSPDIEQAQSRMFRADTDEEVVGILNEWLQRYQPCLFGRMAAKSGQLSYCVLRENDLSCDDELIRDKIQQHRTAWTREAFHGAKSGFLIVAVSETLALAEPNEIVAKIAQRICSLYVLEDVAFDCAHLEEIFLEQPGARSATWRWDAGINYFASHGDKRWWHDHRIPGGICFSINSVGHMAKSGMLRKALAQLNETMGTSEDADRMSKIESLAKALEVAMRTIDMAADTVSGKATYLLPLPSDAPQCPVKLPDFLGDKDYREYFGTYHTDYTLPGEYFRPDIERPELQGHALDFTYLFDSRIDNPDYLRMGVGRRVRGPGGADARGSQEAGGRLGKVLPDSLPISRSDRLTAALK